MSDVFLPWGQADRQIYRFHDGTSERAVDPFDVLRKLQAIKGLAIEADLAMASAAEAGGEFAVQGEAAIARLASGTREAFGIPSLSVVEGKIVGLTDAEAMALVVDFGTFVGGLAESTRPLPNSPGLTEASADQSSTTESGLDSG